MATQRVPLTSISACGNTERPVHEPSSSAISRFASQEGEAAMWGGCVKNE